MKLIFRLMVLAICLGTIGNMAWAQQPPAFRSVQGGGNWGDLGTWEQQNPVSGGWGPADHVPGSADGQITIRHFSFGWNGVYITSNLSADELIVDDYLTIYGATLEITDGPIQQDLSVSATGVLVLGQGVEGGFLTSQNAAGCEIKPAGKLQVWNGSIDNSGPMSVLGTLELANGFIVNYDTITVGDGTTTGAVLRTGEGGINNIGKLWVRCNAMFRMENPGIRFTNEIGKVQIDGGFRYEAGCMTYPFNSFTYDQNCHTLTFAGTPQQVCTPLTYMNEELQNLTDSSSLDAFWPTTPEGPTNITVEHFTLGSPRTVSGSFRCPMMLQLNAPLTITGTSLVSGTIQINEGGAVIGNDLVYTGPLSTLVLNVPQGSSIDSTSASWPSTNGPSKVFLQGTGSITLNAPRTVEQLFISTTVSGGNYLTVNQGMQLRSGGSITGAPTYSIGSTLFYATGGTYARGDEWSATSGPGYPVNVTIGNNTILDYPNGSTAARAISGNLLISSGSALYMDFGNIGVNNPLTIGGGIAAGALSLGDAPGGDLYLKGNWSVGGNFTQNSRRVIFNGSTQQIIGYSATAFDSLTIANPAGVRLDYPITVNTLNFSAGNLVLPYILTLTGRVHDASRMRHAVTLYSGYISRTISPGDSFQFPISGSDTSYNPVTVTNVGFNPETFAAQVADTFIVSPAVVEEVLRRQWRIFKSGLISPYTLRCQWEENDPTGLQFNPEGGVGIQWFDGTQWVETEAAYNAGPPRTASATVSFPIAYGGIFGIGNLGGVTGVPAHQEVPRAFALSQNYPNPFNPVTRIQYSIGSSQHVTLKVYDLLGKEVATLVDQQKPAGEYGVEFDASRLSSGLYFYTIEAGNFRETKKMMLMK